MSFLTATVPVFTEDDEIKELKSLTEQEQASIEADVYGLSYDNITKDGRTQVDIDPEEAWRNLFDEIRQSPNNSAIKKALERCSELVKTEINLVQFLRCENFQRTAAAQRLIGYWTLRLSLFGEDRAFLPMTLEGAMRDDREVMETGSIAMALEEDGAGRPVILWDRVRAADVDRYVALRCLFYTVSALIRRKTICDEGCVVLINYNGCSNIRKYYDRFVTRNVAAIGNCLPVHVCSLHFYTGVSRRNVAALLLPVVKQLVGRTFRLRFQVHYGSDLAGIFARYKLSDAHAEAMVGSLELRKAIASRWIQEQLELEQHDAIDNCSKIHSQ